MFQLKNVRISQAFQEANQAILQSESGVQWSLRAHVNKLKFTLWQNQEKVRDFLLLAHAARGMCDRGTLHTRSWWVQELTQV